ncbi:sensor histidine kinase [Paenibacillus sp. J5C_2022]|uniref:sensor histidine kinase n=1 Tax=Paenibacillus sp. J5C2022 TaxID=2977129 RepID=UPI0021D200C6|nr:sensor histidine kinase [Paenibacillus sp. J5C2022]MCU6707354.1 sensor histidine kinase [Paenibacillus sp. J5C2022]
MKFRSLRNRLIFIAFLLSVLSEGFLIAISYWNTSGIGIDIRQAARQNVTKHVESQLMTKLKDISSLATQLNSMDFINYSREYYNLRPPEEAERLRTELNDRLNKLHLQPSLVERAYFIGQNENQKNLGKQFSQSSLIPEEQIPWIDELRDTGLIDLFTRFYDMPTYIPHGMFTAPLGQMKHLQEGKKERLQAFFESIEGHMIINNGVNSLNVLTVIVLDDQMLSMALPGEDSWDGYITLLDNNDHILWSNLNDEQVIGSAIENSKQGKTQWVQEWDAAYEVRTNTIVPYGITLLFFERKASNVIWDSLMLRISVLSLGTTLLISLLVSIKLSNRIMYPFNVLARISWKKESNIDFEHIPEDRFSRLSLSRFSIRNKILLLLFTSVMIPFIAAVVLHVALTYHSMFNKLVDSTVQSANQIVKETCNRMDSYESLTNSVATDTRLTSLFMPYNPAPGIDEKFPISSYPGLVDVSYFILYNSQGLARYSSTFINNIGLFRLSTSEMTSLEKLEPEEIVWVAGKKDVYDHPAIMLIKKLSLPTPDGTMADAYLQMVLKEDTFQSVTSDRRETIVLLDEASDKAFYSSAPEQGFAEMAVQEWSAGTLEREQSQIRKVGSSNQVMMQRAIPDSQWTATLFFTIDDIHLKINEMLYRYLLLIVLIFAAILAIVWYLSLLLVKPIERLTQALEAGEALDGTVIEELNRRDEVGLLVLSFNNMITKINDLMEENIKKQIREKDLVTSKMKAELGMLQQQINPHFLYNTLEAINMRARQYGAVEVSAMVNSLAKIFRFTINTGSEVVPLAEEIEHVRNYLTIQELRFKDAFIVQWKITVPASLPILKFILQPIVENALQHGIEELYEQGIIRIAIHPAEGGLQIEISDNGLGMDEEVLEQLRCSLTENYEGREGQDEGEAGNKSDGGHEHEISDQVQRKRSTGVGLRNVYHRLRIYYGEEFAMHIESQEFGGTTVTLHIPLDMDASLDE